MGAGVVRVKERFVRAKGDAPSIVFVDEVGGMSLGFGVLRVSELFERAEWDAPSIALTDEVREEQVDLGACPAFLFTALFTQ